MAVLRAATEPLDRELILQAGTHQTDTQRVATSISPDLLLPTDIPPQVHAPLKALYALSSTTEQLQRCYAGLLADSLTHEVTEGNSVFVSL